MYQGPAHRLEGQEGLQRAPVWLSLMVDKGVDFVLGNFSVQYDFHFWKALASFSV